MEQLNNQKPVIKKSSNGPLITIIVIVSIVLVSLVVAGIYFGAKIAYVKIKNKAALSLQESASELSKIQNSVGNIQQSGETSQNPGTTYANSEFGFSVTMPDSWKDYQIKMEAVGGDFEVEQFNFYFPTQVPNLATKLPGYINLFTLSAYIKYSWDENKAVGGTTVLGEEIGRNDQYVFVYSHFNGEAPADIPQAAILDMEKIIQSFQVKSTGEETADYADFEQNNLAKGNRPAKDAAFAQNSVYYWNCKHQYTLNYPLAWSNNGMTYDSSVVMLYGKNLQTRIEAIAIPVSKTLQTFAEERSRSISGVQAWSEAIDWDGKTTLFQYSFTKPEATAIYWLSGNYGLEMKISGTGYNLEYDNIKNMLATLEPNYVYKTCSATSGATISPKTTPKSTDCSFPNGDVEFWWDNASATIRDCFIQKGGIPPASYRP